MTGSRITRKDAVAILKAELDETQAFRTAFLRQGSLSQNKAITEGPASFEAEIKEAAELKEEFEKDLNGANLYSNKENGPTLDGVIKRLEDQKKFYAGTFNKTRITAEIQAITDLSTPLALTALNAIAIAKEEKPDDIYVAILVYQNVLGGKTLLEIKLPNNQARAFVAESDLATLRRTAIDQLKKIQPVVEKKAVEGVNAAIRDIKTSKTLETLLALARLEHAQEIRNLIANNPKLFYLGTMDPDTLKSPLVITSNTASQIQAMAQNHIVTAIPGIVSTAIGKLTDLAALDEIAKTKDNSALIRHWNTLGLSHLNPQALIKSNPYMIPSVLASFQAAAAKQQEAIKPKATPAEAKSSTPPPKSDKDKTPRLHLIQKISSSLFELEQARKAYATLDSRFNAKTVIDEESQDALNYMTSAVDNKSPISETEEKKVEQICTQLAASKITYISKSNSVLIRQNLDTIKDLKNPATLRALNELALADEKQLESTIKAHQSVLGGTAPLTLDEQKTPQVIIEEAEAITVMGKAIKTLQVLAEKHITEKLTTFTNEAALQEFLSIPSSKPSPSATRSWIQKHKATLGDIDLGTHILNDETIIDNNTAIRLATAITKRAQEVEALKSKASLKPATTPADAKTAADAKTVPADAKVAGAPKDINAEIKKSLSTIANGIDLSGDEKEIKAIVNLVTDDAKDAESTHLKIVALKNKLGVLKDAKPEELELKKIVISGENAKGIRDQVSTLLENLIQDECKTAIKTWGTDKAGDLLQFQRAVIASTSSEDAALLIRTFVNDHRKDLSNLKNFPDNALKNPLVFKNPGSFYNLVLGHLNTLVPQGFEETKNTITGLKLAEEKQAIALAELAMADDSDIPQTLINQKDQLGACLKHFHTIDDAKIFTDAGVKALRQKARDAIQAQIKKTVTDKIQTLKLPDDQKLLDAIADAKDAPTIRKALVNYKNQLGLGHLDDNHILKAGGIIPKNDPMLTSFKKSAFDRRTNQTPEARIVADAIAKLQTELTATDPISPAYKNLKDTLFNPDTRAALLALAGHTSITTGAPDVAARADKLANILRPLIKTEPTGNTEADISKTLTGAQGATPVPDTSAIAKAIFAANKAEFEAQEVKRLYDALIDKSGKVTSMATEAKELADKAKTAASVDSSKETEAKAAIAAHDKLTAQQKTIGDALKAIEKELESITAPGVGAPAVSPTDAFTRAKAAFDPHKDAETTAKDELDKVKAAYTAAQPHAPARLEAIPGQVIIDGREKNAFENDSRELRLCRKIEDLYDYNFRLKNAAEAGDTRAFAQLTSAMLNIQVLIDNITTAKTATADVGVTKVRDLTSTWLTKAQGDLTLLKIEMESLQKNEAMLKERVRVFSPDNRTFTEDELANMNKDKAQFDSWKTTILGAHRAPPAEQNVFEIGNSTAHKAQYTNSAKPELIENYRVYPPTTITRNDLVYYEVEKRATAKGPIIEHQMIGLDLPETVSDRGALIAYLAKNGATSRSDNNAQLDESNIRNLVYQHLPPVLTEKAVLNFLKTVVSTGSILESNEQLAQSFMQNELKAYRTEKIVVHKQFENKSNPADKKTLEEYLRLPPEAWENYRGVSSYFNRKQESIEIPKTDVFKSAALLLSKLDSSGRLPTVIRDIRCQELLVAIDCIAQIQGLDAKIEFPKTATVRATPEQITAARIMGYGNLFANPAVVKEYVDAAQRDIAGHIPHSDRRGPRGP